MTTDYSFNADIVAAMKAGKEVWSSVNGKDWFTIKDLSAFNLHATYMHQWSLTKPMKKVKKWQWIHTNGTRYVLSRAHYATKEIATANIGNEVVEPYLPSEIEEEEA